MNVIVLFSAGLGGNHLSNMIATDPRFHSRATVEEYQSHTGIYAATHLGKLTNNLNNLELLEHDDNNVLSGHLGEFIWTDTSRFKNLQIVLIETPKDHASVSYQRWQDYSRMQMYYQAEQSVLYSQNVVEKITGITDINFMPSESLFNKTAPIEILQEMNYNIDVAQCNKMHTHWFENNLFK